MTTDNMPPRMTPERALELHGECVAKYKLGKKSVMTTDNMPPQNAMRCDYCNINFADRQPGSVCPKCYRELSRIAVTMTTDNMPPLLPVIERLQRIVAVMANEEEDAVLAAIEWISAAEQETKALREQLAAKNESLDNVLRLNIEGAALLIKAGAWNDH